MSAIAAKVMLALGLPQLTRSAQADLDVDREAHTTVPPGNSLRAGQPRQT
jgi:hypothetical protein